MYSGGVGPVDPVDPGFVFTRYYAKFTGSPTDELKVGSHALLIGPSSGGNVSAVRGLGFNVGNSTSGNIELLAAILVPPTSYAAFDAALNTLGGYGPGAIAV